jgi:hypothetical protein
MALSGRFRRSVTPRTQEALWGSLDTALGGEAERQDAMRRGAKIALGVVGGVVVVFVVAGVAGGGASSSSTSSEPSPAGSKDVSEATWTDGAWPLTVPSGTLACTGGDDEVTFNTTGTTYGVNGTAISHGLPPIDPIWKAAADPGPRADLGPLIQEGIKLCQSSAGSSSS